MDESITAEVVPRTSLITKIVNSLRLPYREDKLFGVLAAACFLIPLVFSIYGRENFETIKLVALMITVGWGVLLVFKGKQISLRFYKPVLILVGLFWLFAIFSTLNSSNILHSLFGRYRFTDTLLFDTLWVALILLLISALNTAEKYLLLVKAIIASALIIAIFGLLQSTGIAFYEGLSAPTFSRVPSLLGNPNFSAMFVASVLPFALFLIAESRTLVSKIYYALTTIIIISALIAFNSRGALIGLVVSLVVGLILTLFYLRNRGYIKYLVGAIVLPLVLFFLYVNVARPGILDQTLNFTDINTTSRVYIAAEAVSMFMAHPWAGVGLDNFVTAFEQNRGSQFQSQVGLFDDAHNLILHLAATGGLPYVLSFLSLILVAIIVGLKQLRQNKQWITVAGLAALVSFMISASFNPVTIAPWVLLALILSGLVYSEAKVLTFNNPISLRVFAIGLGVVCILSSINFLAAEYVYTLGATAYSKNDFNKAYKYFKVATIMNPISQDFLTFRAYSELFSKKSSAMVENTLATVQALRPFQEEPYRKASGVYFLLYESTEKKQYLEQAIAGTKMAVDFDPQTPTYYPYLYRFYRQAGLIKQSLTYLNRAVVFLPDEYHYWLLFAKAYQSEGDKAQTLYALQKAFKIAPNAPEVKEAWEASKKEKDIKKIPIQVRFYFSGIDGN